MSDFEVDESEEVVQMFELRVGDMPAALVGIGLQTKDVYVSGDLHPVGAFSALMLAAKEHVPYISTSAVNALFPIDWIRGACLHDMDRLRILENLERIARGASV